MKTNTIQEKLKFKINLVLPLLSPLIFFLMVYSLPCSEIFCAVFFTAMVYASPDIFRTRAGSLGPAVCLAAFLWLCAAVVFVLSFFGAH